MRDIVSDSRDKVIIIAIITMAKSVVVEMIAEGVEVKDQQQLILNIDCIHIQGYLFGIPIPNNEFEDLLSNS